MAGCKGCDEKVGTGAYKEILGTNMFTIVDDTLHIGNISAYYSSGGFAGAGYGISGLNLGCGQYILTNEFKAYKNEPFSELYDHKCEICFEK